MRPIELWALFSCVYSDARTERDTRPQTKSAPFRAREPQAHRTLPATDQAGQSVLCFLSSYLRNNARNGAGCRKLARKWLENSAPGATLGKIGTIYGVFRAN